MTLGSVQRAAARPTVLVSTLPSDAHTWNLVFLQLLLEELGCDVVNLGPCVPVELLLQEITMNRPDLLVISSVNGHGYRDGLRVGPRVRALPEAAGMPMVIGGKLGISGGERDTHLESLLKAGFDAVLDDRAADRALLHRWVRALPERAVS